MGSNYYSFLNCTVYKARTSRNNFRPPPLRSSSTRLRSFSILRRVSTAGILFLHAIAHAGNRGGIHPFAGFKTIRRRFVGSDWFYPILFAKAASTSTRSTSPLTSIISYGFFSLSLSLTAASSLVIRDKETTIDIVRSRNGWEGSYESRKRVILLCSFLCNFSGSKNISLFFRKEIFRQIFVSNSYLVI